MNRVREREKEVGKEKRRGVRRRLGERKEERGRKCRGEG